MMAKKRTASMNLGVIIFILASAVISYMLARVNLNPQSYAWFGNRYGYESLAMLVGFWAYHAILTRKCLLNAANTWLCSVITLLISELMVWGVYSLYNKWYFYLGMVAILIYLPIYCGSRYVNGWIIFLAIALEVATAAYLYILDFPQTTGTIYKVVNGLRAFTFLLACIQTLVDIISAARAYAEKSAEERKRRAAEREAKRIAQRRIQLPVEIAEMQDYSLNILPFLRLLQSEGQPADGYGTLIKNLLAYSKELSRIAAVKNDEAASLGLPGRVQIHST